ncbi:MAG TPA: ABC transporter permease [Candidatus Sulfomarinibacteraceae bacterium]|nr:ABC transporter permease [Candidatus Sulfomarinibacteraceae bacterium]
MNDLILSATIVTWLAMSVRLATPLLFTALGGLVAQKSGVFNFALEGMMLMGAFFGYVGALYSGSLWVGLLCALLAGAIMGLILAFTSVTLGVSQLVVGIGMSIFAAGFTGYFYRLMQRDVAAGGNTIANLQPLPIPLLGDIPIVGPILFNHNILVYLSVVLVVIIAVIFSRTPVGLNLRAVGENPRVADTVGIRVHRMRYAAVIISGILAGAGGAFLTLTQVSRFLENLVDGRGWIALAAVILGKYSPWGVLGACLLFGAADALQMQLQIFGLEIPHQILLMTPYLMAMLALAGVVGRVRGPAGQGKPYFKS